MYRRGPELGRPGVIRTAGSAAGLRGCLQVGRDDPLRLVGRWQMKPDRGAGRVSQVTPLGSEVLDQEQSVALGCVQVALYDGGARRAVIDDLDQDAVRYADDDDGDGPAIDTGLGVLDDGASA